MSFRKDLSSSVQNEIAISEEENNYNCDTNSCIYNLSFFTEDYFNRLATHTFNTVSVSNNLYEEKPDFVFYNKDGTSVFVVTKLLDIPTPKSYILELSR